MKTTLFVKRVACAYADHLVRATRQLPAMQTGAESRRAALTARRAHYETYLEQDLDEFLHLNSRDSLSLPIQQDILQSLPPTIPNLIDLALTRPATFDTSIGQLLVIDSATAEVAKLIKQWESIVALRHVSSSDNSHKERAIVHQALKAYCRTHPDLDAVVHELEPIAYAGRTLQHAEQNPQIPREDLADFLMSDRLMMRYMEVAEHVFQQNTTLDGIIGSTVWQRLLDDSLQREAVQDLTVIKDIPQAHSIAVLRELRFPKVVADIVVEHIQQLLEDDTQLVGTMTNEAFAIWLWKQLYYADVVGPSLSQVSLTKLCESKKGCLDFAIRNSVAWPSLLYRIICKTIGAAENQVRLINQGKEIAPLNMQTALKQTQEGEARPQFNSLVNRISQIETIC